MVDHNPQLESPPLLGFLESFGLLRMEGRLRSSRSSSFFLKCPGLLKAYEASLKHGRPYIAFKVG